MQSLPDSQLSSVADPVLPRARDHPATLEESSKATVAA